MLKKQQRLKELATLQDKLLQLDKEIEGAEAELKDMQEERKHLLHAIKAAQLVKLMIDKSDKSIDEVIAFLEAK